MDSFYLIMRLPSSIRHLGFLPYLRYRWMRVWQKYARHPLKLTARNSAFPIQVRPGSSDFSVFRQIFVEEEYAPLAPVQAGGLVVDCGANIGCSSTYFLSRFPGCRVVAIEPDADNFRILSRNLAPYSPRVKLHHAAVWGNVTQLRLASDQRGAGFEWGRHVEECSLGDDFSASDSIEAVTIEGLLAATSANRIDLLKIDIEGAETSLFGANSGCEQWLQKVDQIAIELHDTRTRGEASRCFLAAVGGGDWELSQSGELTLAKRVARRKAN